MNAGISWCVNLSIYLLNLFTTLKCSSFVSSISLKIRYFILKNNVLKLTYINIIVRGVIIFEDHSNIYRLLNSSVLYSKPLISMSLYSTDSFSTITFNSSGNNSFQLKQFFKQLFLKKHFQIVPCFVHISCLNALDAKGA